MSEGFGSVLKASSFHVGTLTGQSRVLNIMTRFPEILTAA